MAIVLLLALLYSATPIWPTLGLPPAGGPALPRTAYAPDPESELGSADPITELDLNRSSLVLDTNSSEVVLVEAQTGKHRRATLPGHRAFLNESAAGPVALSADGRHLAWGYADFTKDEAGIALLGLGDDEIRRLPLVSHHDKPVRVTQLSWSPDGSHLAWYGDEVAGWNNSASTFIGPIRTYGATRADTLSADFRSDRDGPPGVVAVADDGRAHALLGTELLSFDAGNPAARPQTRIAGARALPWSSAAVDDDGSTLIIGVNGRNVMDAMSSGLRTLDLTDPDSQLVHSNWGVTHGGDRVDVLGHTPMGGTVALRTPAQDPALTEVLVLDADSESAWPVTAVHGPWHGHALTVATDLADQAPLDTRAPFWMVSQIRWAFTAFFAALLAIEALSALVRRRRLRAGNPTDAARV